MGACLPRQTELKDYPIPSLSLAGELDGVAHITRMAEEFAELKKYVLESFSNLYRTPVFLLEEVNHVQFASNTTIPFASVTISDHIIHDDLASKVAEEDAKRMIGKLVNHFLTVTFSLSPILVNSVQRILEKTFDRSYDKFQPF
ncbi:hypothetical protein RRG08_045977 [Elysia crispata]|uniref:Uncharacterized protein n=1 Tax=Elysia crispata TaxID=231223 RepID=A0AAE1E325_9GAST|nr:hypothetical protein RRG08_045977 [Elysia crispata]